MTNTDSEAAWVERQVQRYGPLVGGPVLRGLLGFRTAAAFQKARQSGEIGAKVFPISGRQGMFALTEDVCQWVLEEGRRAAQPSQAMDGTGGGP